MIEGNAVSWLGRNLKSSKSHLLQRMSFGYGYFHTAKGELMNKQTVRILFVLTLILSLFLVACQETPPTATTAPGETGSTAGGTTDDTTGETIGGTTGGTTGETTGGATGGASGGAIISGDIILDPAAASDETSLQLNDMLYDSLVELDADGSVTGGLAGSWNVSEDGLTYTFNLRPGLAFSDDSPVDADAVIANFNRWFDPESEFRGSGAYDAWKTAFLGFKGETDSSGVAVSSVDGIEKVDALTVLIHLNRPDPDFLNKLAQVQFSVVNPAVLASGNPGAETEGVSGTGAYVIQEWTADRLVLAPNPGYWGAQAGGDVEFTFE